MLSENFQKFSRRNTHDTYYFAVFALFPSKTETKYDLVLLGFSPFENKENMKAHNLAEFVEFALGIFDKSLDNAVSVTTSNCSVNVVFVRSIGCGFVSCASHRYNRTMTHN